MEQSSRTASLAAVAALGDPVRRALYEFVSGRDAPVGRDEAADSLALNRSTAAFHLDRLAQEGLLEVEFRRLGGKTGPGSGRPAKLYRRAPSEIAVTLPERHYELAGDVLASAIEQADETGEPVRLAVRRVAGEAGRAAGASAASFEDALESNGFEPRTEPGGDIVLGNCPFHQLARRHTQIVCDLNLELVRGVAEGAGDQCHTIVQDPDAGRCCVRAVPQHTDGAQRRLS
jgi:predicted ArsR family transcriptional regulator